MHKDPEKIKAQILSAALARFSKVGFQKTNVREIAADCEMSPANIYRFFDGKDEIGMAVVSRHLAHTRGVVKGVLASGEPAQEKLKNFVLQILEYNFEIFSSQPQIFELIQFISQKKPEMPRQHVMLKKNCLIEILSQGLAAKELKVESVTETAQLLFQALRPYLLPHSLLNSPAPLEQWRQEAQGLIELMFTGLNRPS